MRALVTRTLVVALGMGLASAARATEPVKVGAALELSGRFVAFGSHCKRGIDMASEALKLELPGTPIDFVFHDVESNASATVSAFTQMTAEEKLNFIIGPIASPIAASAIPAWRQAKPVWIVPGASTVTMEKEVGTEPNFFHAFPYAYQYHVQIAGMLKEFVNPKTVSIVYTDDDYGRSHLPLAEKYLKQAGFNILSEEIVRANSADMNSVLTKISFAKPEVLLALMQTTDSITLAKQVYTRRLKVPYLIGTFATQLKEWQDAVGPAQEGWTGLASYLPDLVNYPANPTYPKLLPSTRDWEAAFRAKYAQDPNYDDSLCYSLAVAMAIAVKNAGSNDKEKIAQALRDLDIDTVYGHLKWTQTEGGTKQNAYDHMIIFQRQNGKNVTVYPPEAANGKLLPVSR
jgi:branched-chain amino acid transport system substrate-binding protein